MNKIQSVLAEAASEDITQIPILFHNTVKIEGKDLKEAQRRASKQEEAILAFFRAHNTEIFTPCQVAEQFPNWPITSIRRSITNLTNRGELIKTNLKRLGVYGVINFCWKAA